MLQRLAALAPNARSTAQKDTQPFMLHAAAADTEMGQAFAFSRQVLLAAAMGFDACWEAAPRLAGRLAGAGLRALLGAALLGACISPA